MSYKRAPRSAITMTGHSAEVAARNSAALLAAACQLCLPLAALTMPAALASHEPAKVAPAKANKFIGDDVPMQVWRDVSVTPWAVLLCIHGLSLHATSYTAFGKAMSHLGVPTYAIDVRGFGSWQNTEEDTKLDFSLAFSDIKNSLVAIKRSNPGLPVIIVGESMGGGIALQAAAANPTLVDGLICSVPSRRNSGQQTTNLKAAIGLIYNPNWKIPIGDKVIKRATAKADVAEEWENDPMTRKRFTAKELMQFRALMNDNRLKAEQITKIPVLFLQGGSDKLIKPTGTVELYNHLKTNDKDLVMVGSAEHLILEQGQFDDKIQIKDDVISLLTNWIDKHVANTERSLAAIKDPSKTMEENSDLTRQAHGHIKIAEGNMLLNDPETAKDHLLTVLRIARGTALAQKADQMLLTLPEHLIAPPVNSDKHDSAQLISLNSAMSNEKPTMLVFCAPWIESCKTILQDVHEALGADEDKVNIVYVDADKEENQSLLKEYGVKPLPAVLYLSYKNEVLLYTLGDPGVVVTRSRIKQLLAADAKLQEKEKEKEKESAEAKPAL